MTQQPFLYEAVATITPRTASTISSKLMGTVQAIHVREGDRVKSGDLLVVVDQRQVSAQLDRAEAGVQEARRAEASAVSAHESTKAAADLAASTYKRYQQLLDSDSVSQQEFDSKTNRTSWPQPICLATGISSLGYYQFRFRRRCDVVCRWGNRNRSRHWYRCGRSSCGRCGCRCGQRRECIDHYNRDCRWGKLYNHHHGGGHIDHVGHLGQ